MNKYNSLLACATLIVMPLIFGCNSESKKEQPVSRVAGLEYATPEELEYIDRVAINYISHGYGRNPENITEAYKMALIMLKERRLVRDEIVRERAWLNREMK